MVPDPTAGVPPHVPSRAELYEFFNNFILKWLKVPSQKVDGVQDDIQPLPIEQGILFTEPAPGILVLRTSEDFAQGLARLAKERHIDHDLFMEMLVVFWHRFLSHFWRMDSRTLAPAFFKRSLPAQWPDRKPDSQLLVFILQKPVEVRLWLNLTPEEKDRWKKR